MLSSLPLCHRVFSCQQKTRHVDIYLSQNGGFPITTKHSKLEVIGVEYHPLCKDFGPMSLSAISKFIDLFDKELAECSSESIVYSVKTGRRELTNGVFLLGTYMLLRLGMKLREVSGKFDVLNPNLFEPFRDASDGPSMLDISLVDCWRGIRRAQKLHWLAYPSRSNQNLWGRIDLEEYSFYNEPLNGDLNEVVPGKFLAFAGPHNLNGAEYRDDPEHGTRLFSPSYYIDIFRELGVSTVVRLNEAQYDRTVFTKAGFQHFDLFFNEGTTPAYDIVDRFHRIADTATGVVAVHCKSGRGRTGTLIAAHLIRSHGFTAREAIAWLRVMRPGSVLGEQQLFLCEQEKRMENRSDPSSTRSRQSRRGAPNWHSDAAAVAPAGEGHSGRPRNQDSECGAPQQSPRQARSSLQRVDAGDLNGTRHGAPRRYLGDGKEEDQGAVQPPPPRNATDRPAPEVADRRARRPSLAAAEVDKGRNDPVSPPGVSAPRRAEAGGNTGAQQRAAETGSSASASSPTVEKGDGRWREDSKMQPAFQPEEEKDEGSGGGGGVVVFSLTENNLKVRVHVKKHDNGT